MRLLVRPIVGAHPDTWHGDDEMLRQLTSGLLPEGSIAAAYLILLSMPLTGARFAPETQHAIAAVRDALAAATAQEPEVVQSVCEAFVARNGLSGVFAVIGNGGA